MQGGVAHNPDQVLIYANPEGVDGDLKQTGGGVINFNFKLKVGFMPTTFHF